jgi:hypothetical protein
MKRKNMILFAGLFVCLVLIIIGVRLYNKPRTTAASVKADINISAQDLYNSFIKNEQAANQLYVNKVMEIRGKVKEVQHQSGNMSVLLEGDGTGGVVCSLTNEQSVSPQIGLSIRLKGRCTGFLTDVYVIDAIIYPNQ